jgi:hypothetical protein
MEYSHILEMKMWKKAYDEGKNKESMYNPRRSPV